MKTERRHELQTNVLADWLAHEIEKLKPYSKAILGVVVAVLVIFGASIYLRSRASAKQEEGWDLYFSASMPTPDPQKLMEVGDEHPSSSVGYWSRLLAADVQLSQGTTKMFNDRAAARVELNKAIENYQSVLDSAREPLFVDRARFGLARAYEALDDLAKARENYEIVAKAGSKSPYAEAAKRRLDDLSKASTKEFYDWFAKYQVKSALPSGLGLPGTRPEFDLDKSPDEPDFKPSTSFDPGKLFDGKTPGKPADIEKPAETKPAETKPAETKPADKPEPKQPAEAKPAETKADEAKPADTKPADATPAAEKPAESAPEKGK
ncbi:MAG: YfgM family protein [Pirellulales bacterium]